MGNHGMNDSTIDKAVRVYDAISWYFDSEAQSPVIRELMVLTNIPSSAVMQQYLAILRGWGWIEWEQGCARTIRPTRPSECIVEMPKPRRKRKAKASVANVA